MIRGDPSLNVNFEILKNYLQASENLARLQASIPAPEGAHGQGRDIETRTEQARNNGHVELEGEDTVVGEDGAGGANDTPVVSGAAAELTHSPRDKGRTEGSWCPMVGSREGKLCCATCKPLPFMGWARYIIAPPSIGPLSYGTVMHLRFSCIIVPVFCSPHLNDAVRGPLECPCCVVHTWRLVVLVQVLLRIL